MTNTNRTLVDWLDDLCVRFIVNLPHEELQSVERICFQIEEALRFHLRMTGRAAWACSIPPAPARAT